MKQISASDAFPFISFVWNLRFQTTFQFHLRALSNNLMFPNDSFGRDANYGEVSHHCTVWQYSLAETCFPKTSSYLAVDARNTWH